VESGSTYEAAPVVEEAAPVEYGATYESAPVVEEAAPVESAPVVEEPTTVTEQAPVGDLAPVTDTAPQQTWMRPGEDGRFAPSTEPLQPGEQPREIVGDLTTAKNIAVVVHGINNTPEGYDTPYGSRAKALNIGDAANALSDGNAVVTFSYDAPQTGQDITSAARDDKAAAAAPELAQMVRDIRAANPDANITIIGHSYGTRVVGDAIRDAGGFPGAGESADDRVSVVLAGGPGTGAAGASELGFNGPVYAVRNPNDPIQLAGENQSRPLLEAIIAPFSGVADAIKAAGYGHGNDPTSIAFNDNGQVTRLHTDGANGHQYFENGSESLSNIARVITGIGGVTTGDRPDAAPINWSVEASPDGMNRTDRWVNTASQAISQAGQWASDTAQATGQWASETAQATGQRVSDAAQATGQWVSDTAQATGQWVSETAQATGQRISDAAHATGSWIGDRAQAVSNWWNGR
jgi:pimeloyl-ACP methyl ester carboxylesterase